ncbi:MAG: hypothetical protein N3A01_06050 [Bacteroidales bacterium]|nr:hypothetical protein [Bacteroidales bacterium]
MKNLVYIIIVLVVLKPTIFYSQIGVGLSNDPSFNTPQSPLHIYITNDGNLLQLSRSPLPNTGLIFSVNNNDYSIINKHNNSLILGTNNTEFIRIANNGYIGIGTTTPLAQLHTTGTVRFANYSSGANGAILRTNSNGDLSIINFSGNSNDVLLGNGTFGPPVTSSTAWQLIGNSGTNPNTNFLGTIDNQSLVLKTNNTERMRILNTGQVLVNLTSPLSSKDLFSAQSTSTYTDAICGYSNQPGGMGIVGINTTTTGNGSGCGVYGQSYQTEGAGVFGSGGNHTRGVVGYNNSALYAAIQAQNDHNNGDALYAVNNASSGIGSGTAIWASSNQSGASTICANLISNLYFSNAAISAVSDASLNGARGIIAQSNNTTGVAIQGQTSGTQGIGVLGINSSTTANYNAIGVWGQSSNPNGSAGYFYNNAPAGTGYGDGLNSLTSQTQGMAVYAFNQHTLGTAILAGGNNVSNLFYPTNGCGGSFNGSTFGLFAYKVGAFSSNTGAAAFIASSDANTGVYVAYRSSSETNYKIIDIAGFGGSVSTDVLGEEGLKDARLMFAPEATEIFLQDFGRAQLVNGRAYVKLDPIYAKNIIVNEKYPLHVYIQLEGDCKGVYVTNKSNEGFEVVELQGGTSNVSFTYFVNGHRRDYINPETGELISKHEGIRLPLAPKPPDKSSRQSNIRLINYNSSLILEPKKSNRTNRTIEFKP